MAGMDEPTRFTDQELRAALAVASRAKPLLVYLAAFCPPGELRDFEFASLADLASRLDVPLSEVKNVILDGGRFHVRNELGDELGGLWTADWCDEPGRRYVRVRLPRYFHEIASGCLRVKAG